MVSLCVGSSAGSVMAQESSDPQHVNRAVQEIRQEDPAALVEMEERAKRPKHMSLWDKLQVLGKFKEFNKLPPPRCGTPLRSQGPRP